MSSLKVENPATGEELGQVPISNPEQVTEAVSKAHAAQKEWAKVSVKERGRRLIEFRNLIRDHSEELTKALSNETGKPYSESLMMELLGTTDLITHFSRKAHRILKKVPFKLHLYPTRRSYLHYVPRGVVGIISPWNFPFSIPIGQTVMALLAGNAVVLKPSEYTPIIALKVKQLFDQAGIPSDLFQVVPGDGATGEALVHSDIQLMVFTGSVAVGKQIAAICGKRLLPVVLELGGKAPAIIFEDADLDRTVDALLWGAFANSGQVCASVERVYVQEKVHDSLLDLLESRIRKLRQGNPESDVDIGSMAQKPQLDHVSAMVEQAITEGARLICGGKVKSGPGHFYEPTLLDCDHSDLEIFKKEIFGPVLPVISFRTEEEVIEEANSSHLGLLAYVFTENKTRGLRVADRIEAGTVMINDVLSTFAMPEAPWHGLKQSGLGVVHSSEGLRQMCQLRHVHHERFRIFKKEVWWFPYSQKKLRRSQRLYRFLFTRIFR